jgi:hypothetical protein
VFEIRLADGGGVIAEGFEQFVHGRQCRPGHGEWLCFFGTISAYR